MQVVYKSNHGLYRYRYGLPRLALKIELQSSYGVGLHGRERPVQQRIWFGVSNYGIFGPSDNTYVARLCR